MGFARAEIDRAMRAAYFNPDRAVDYLLNGIPESVQAEQRQAAAARANPESGAGGEGQGAGTGAQATSPPPAAGGSSGTTNTDEPVNLFEAAAQAGGRGGATGGQGRGAGAGAGIGAGLAGAPANLDFLRNSPQFQQLRQLVQQQPAMLEPVLQQVADGNPQLAQMIGQNQEQFLQLLSEVSICTLLFLLPAKRWKHTNHFIPGHRRRRYNRHGRHRPHAPQRGSHLRYRGRTRRH
jgi:UV excision repair protein RAD23